ncbi:MAG: propanediol utilization protein, partial [Verrucomicrobiaceae bacterium]|nr:propanediol utilization protein [Verrucomicrobiaceae bacterium]
VGVPYPSEAINSPFFIRYVLPTAKLNGTPTKFTAIGLPLGLTINATTGLISGVVSGTWTDTKTFTNISITATNAAGLNTLTGLSVRILPGNKPELGTPALDDLKGKVNVFYSYSFPYNTMNADGLPTSWTAIGLPPGLTIDSTGKISGRPKGTFKVATTYKVTVTATNFAGKTTQSFNMVIQPGVLPIFGVPAFPLGKVSVPYNYSADSNPANDYYQFPLSSGSPADALPATWTATGLPPGLTIEAATGKIMGRPSTAGVYKAVKIIATNQAGSVTNPFPYTITINAGQAPQFAAGDPGLPAAQVGKAYKAAGGVPYLFPYDMSANPDRQVLTFTAVGLPAGLTMDKTTGEIKGVPTTAKTYSTIKVTLANLAGSVTNVIPYTIVVSPFDAKALGTFAGLVDRGGSITSLSTPPVTTNTLGARFDLTTTATGSYTGKVTVGVTPTPYAIKGTLDTTPVNPHGVATIVRVGKPTLTVTFDLHVDVTDPGTLNTVTGTVSDGVTTASINGWRNVYSATNKVPVSRQGLHNFIADIPGGAPTDGSVPEGTSFGSANLTPATAATGAAALTFKTARGDVFTNSVPLGPNGELFVYQPLYTNTGSFIGRFSIAADAVHTVSSAPGALTWSRAPQTLAADRTYKAGWAPPIALSVSGGLYTPPLAGAVVMGLSVGPPDNAKISFENGGIVGAAFQPTIPSLLIKPAGGLATIPTNDAKTTLTVVNSTGTFSGTFTLSDPDPLNPTKKVPRTGTYQGMIIPNLATPDTLDGVGHGYFLLPKLADPNAGTTATTSPILSGLVTLEKK